MSETSLTGNEVKALQLPGKMLIMGSYADEWFYPFWQYVTPEAKRKDYTLFLQTSGLIQVIYKFIITLRNMTFRPPPEEAIEFLLKSMGKKLITKDRLTNLKAELENVKDYVENLFVESEQLRLRLENFEPIVTPYETLEPDDFAHLATNNTNKFDPIFGKRPDTIILPKEPSKVEDSDKAHPDHVLPEEDAKTTPPDQDLLVSNHNRASLTIHGQVLKTDETIPTSSSEDDNKQPRADSHDKLRAVAIDGDIPSITEPTLDTLDVHGLSEHFESLGSVDHFQSSDTEAMKKSKKASKKKPSTSGTLPKLEIPETNIDNLDSERNMKLPPRVLNQRI